MKMKLTGIQLVWLIVTTAIVAMTGLRISPAIEIARQDAWLSMLIGGVVSAAFAFLAVNLSARHPNQTLFDYSETLLGRWLGKAIILPYLLAWLLVSGVLLRSFSDFMKLILLDRTPLWIVMLLLVLVMIFLTCSKGITGIGRFCELMGPIIVIVMLASFVFSIKNVELHYLLPFYHDTGWKALLKGSYNPAVWFPGPFILLVVVAFLQDPRQALSRSMLALGITVVMLSAATVMVLLVFGPNVAGEMRFSYFMFVRSIDIMDFVQNVDIFISFIWIFGVSCQLSLYLFVTSYEMARLFRIKNWRNAVWISMPLIFALALLIPDESSFELFEELWTSAIFPVCGIVIPLLLWLVSVFRGKTQKAGSR